MRAQPAKRTTGLVHRGAISLPMVAAAIAMAAFVTFAAAQGRGGPGGMKGGGMSRSPFGDGMSVPNERNSPSPGLQPRERNSMGSTMRGGLQLGPPGRWWDDRDFAKSIGLDQTQQRRMDEVFGANKENLVKLYKNLQHEESQLGKIVRGKELVESQIFDQIDRVVQARGELEKASAHYLLQIRKEMTPEQTAKLDDHLPPQ